MLRLMQVEELEGMLLEVPSFVARYERRDPQFAEGVADWLRRAETALTNCRLPVAAQVAALRSHIVSRSRVVPADLKIRGRATPRAIRDAAAAQSMERASAIITETISESRAHRAEAERVLRQVLAAAEQKGFNFELADIPRGHFLKSLLKTLRQDADLGGATTHAVGLIGADDALIVLDRAIESVVLHR